LKFSFNKTTFHYNLDYSTILLKESDDIRKSILNQLSDKEKENYLRALKKYRNEKPFLEKLMFIIRYSILPKLPNYFSRKIINTYWSAQKSS